MAANKYKYIVITVVSVYLIGCAPAVTPPTTTALPAPSATAEIIPSPTSKPVLLGTDIIHYQADPQRTGSYKFAGIRSLPDVKWEKRMTSSSSLGSPVYANGVLYVSSQNGRLYALDAESGDENWSVVVGQLPASIAISGDVVYVNDINSTTNAILRASGEKVWSVPIEGSGWGAPLVVDGTVFVISERGAYAFEARTGSLIWKVESGEHRGFIGSPSYANGILCYGQGGDFFARDSFTGAELWKLKGDTWFYGSAIANGTVYMGNDDGRFHAYDLRTGAERWQSEIMGESWSAPATSNGVVYVGNVDQHLYAFDAENGEVLWSFETLDWATSDPVVSNGVVYFGVGNHDNRDGPRPLYALDAATGDELWQFEAEGRLMTAPALSDGKVYIVTINGRVYALE